MFSDASEDERTAYWTACKDGSYDLHQRIDAQIKSGAPPTPETMEEWKAELRDFNKNVTRYSHSVAMSETRLRLEAELLKQGMTRDILDREATYTSTLETIRSMEPKGSSSSNSEFLDGTVMRAMQIVGSVNTSMGAVTSAAEPFYGDALECHKLTSRSD
jgi:hypothetical protein